MVLSYFTYYTAPLMVALFTKDFHKPAFWILGVFHFMLYYLIFGRMGANATEYNLYIPLVIIFGLLNGVVVSKRLNLRRPIFKHHWQNFGLWVPFAVVQLVTALVVLVFWELDDAFPRPWGGITTFFAYILIIPMFRFMSGGFDVWSYYCEVTRSVKSDDNACRIFYSVWAVFQLSAVLVFGIFDWAWPHIWNLWVALGVGALHVLFILILEAMKNEYKWKSAYVRQNSKKLQFSFAKASSQTAAATTTTTSGNVALGDAQPMYKPVPTQAPPAPAAFTADYSTTLWTQL